MGDGWETRLGRGVDFFLSEGFELRVFPLGCFDDEMVADVLSIWPM